MSLVDSDLDSLADPFKTRAYQLVNTIQKRGLPFRVFETRRSFTRTQQLFMQGRVTGADGVTQVVDQSKVVSNARPGSSPHNWGVALDCVLITQHDHSFWADEEDLPQNPWDLGDDKRPLVKLAWQRYGQAVRDCDLIWGADWTGGFRDWPHAEIRQWATYRPSDWQPVVLRELQAGR